MKPIALALALALAVTPAVAQEGDMKEGASLIEEGARLLLRGLMSEMEPSLDELSRDMQEFAENAQPAMREMMRLLGDLSAYHPPEVLPNGDIIIRRKTPAEMGDAGEIEL